MTAIPNSRIAFYLATVLLAVAIVATVIGKRYEASVATNIAKATRDHLNYPVNSEERHGPLQTARVLHTVSFAVFFLGVICWGIILYRREKHPRGLLVVLVIVFLMLQLMMV